MQSMERCENCAACGGFPGYGQCEYWTMNTLIKGTVDKLFVQDGDAAFVDKYAKVVGMDENNKNVLKVFKEQGKEAGYAALWKGPDGRELTYAESRAMYG